MILHFAQNREVGPTEGEKQIKNLLSISGEAVVLVKEDVIYYMNDRAVECLGQDYTGCKADTVFSPPILEEKREAFTASGTVTGKNAVVASALLADCRAYRITFDDCENVGIQPLLTAARGALGNVKLVSDRLSRLTEKRGDEGLRPYLAILDHNYSQLKRMFSNAAVIDAEKNGRLPLVSVRTDLVELCGSVVEAVAMFVQKHGVALTFVSELNECFAVVDRELVEQMLLNLISNSLLHLKAGGKVRVTLKADGDKAVLSVDDNGSGIPAAKLPEVLTGKRWEPTPGTNGTGTGLGLQAARCIALRHGGTLLLESREGRGTAVRVLLPTDEKPSVRFHSPVKAYRLDNLDPILVQLSTWLGSEDYRQEYKD